MRDGYGEIGAVEDGFYPIDRELVVKVGENEKIVAANVPINDYLPVSIQFLMFDSDWLKK
jgi:hypothetical protein